MNHLDGDWVALSDDEAAMCDAWTDEILKRAKDSKDKALRSWAARHALKANDPDGVDRVRLGLRAELVVHRLLGTEPTWVAGRFDGGKDGVLSTGHTWDSKACAGAPKYLLVPPTLPVHADCYILVKTTGDRYRIAGWDYWLRIQRYVVGTVKDGGRESHKVPAEDLRAWEDFARIHTHGVERFSMTVDGMEVPVSINHRRRAVKIGNVIYDKKAFNRMIEMGSKAAKKAHAVMDVFDGEFVAGESEMDTIDIQRLLKEEDDD